MKINVVIIILFVMTLFQSCSFTRSMLYWGPNITDHKIFHHDEILPGDNTFYFREGNKEELQKHIISTSRISHGGITDSIKMSLSDFLLQNTTTTAFLVIRNDSVLYEQYFRGYARDAISKNFSITKSVTSLLTGIAVDEGYIRSVHDPVTKYVPELKTKDPKFERLTIEHLLNMRAGFKFNEDNYFPLSKATRLYYGSNHLRLIKRAKFKHEPGEVFEYQSLVSALLGVVVERATGRSLSEYLQEKVWIPMGMENCATWDIDNKRHRSNRAHVGINATAIDLAKIGRLYLNNGNWSGRQIVSADWVAKSITPDRNYLGYQYHWWSHGDRVAKVPARLGLQSYNFSRESLFTDSLSARQYAEEKYPDSKFIEPQPVRGNKETFWCLEVYPNEGAQFAAEGIMHQWIFVDPLKNIIIVRLGEKYDVHPSFIRLLINEL